jgi:hypothetical protein
MVISLKTQYAFSCVVNFYNAGVATRDRRVGSSIFSGLRSVCWLGTRHNSVSMYVHIYIHICILALSTFPFESSPAAIFFASFGIPF